MFEDNPIIAAISQWFRRNFSDPEALSLFMTLVLGFVILELFGNILMPILISIVLAYLLVSIVHFLERRCRIPHMLGVIAVYTLFVSLVIFAVILLIPLMVKQLSNLATELPTAIPKAQAWFNEFVNKNPRLFVHVNLSDIANYLQAQGTHVGKVALQYTLTTLPNIISVVLYFILVPVLVFFFMKDSKPISNWLAQYLPAHRGLVNKVWVEVNEKIAAYVRGRITEILMVGVFSTVAFALIGLQYAMLLGALVGLSVIIPYVGAIVVTIPVVMVGLIQWGLDIHFLILAIVYAAIITVDGYILAPKLLSKFVDLHPIVIIISVVIFGAIWGFWGVFFAIPLAMLINVVLKAWPRKSESELA